MSEEFKRKTSRIVTLTYLYFCKCDAQIVNFHLSSVSFPYLGMPYNGVTNQKCLLLYLPVSFRPLLLFFVFPCSHHRHIRTPQTRLRGSIPDTIELSLEVPFYPDKKIKKLDQVCENTDKFSQGALCRFDKITHAKNFRRVPDFRLWVVLNDDTVTRRQSFTSMMSNYHI